MNKRESGSKEDNIIKTLLEASNNEHSKALTAKVIGFTKSEDDHKVQGELSEHVTKDKQLMAQLQNTVIDRHTNDGISLNQDNHLEINTKKVENSSIATLATELAAFISKSIKQLGLDEEHKIELKHQNQTLVRALNGKGDNDNKRLLPEGFKAELSPIEGEISIELPHTIKAQKALVSDAREHILEQIDGVEYSRYKQAIKIDTYNSTDESIDQVVKAISAIAEQGRGEAQYARSEETTKWIQETQKDLGLQVLELRSAPSEEQNTGRGR